MARPRKVRLDAFEAAIHEVLEEYGTDLRENIGDAVKAVTKKGVQAVKSASRATSGGKGTYAAGWTSRHETGRCSTQGIIYNKDVPGLPHLLENGHALRNGGRVAGRPHIKPVEEKVIQEFETEVKNAI